MSRAVPLLLLLLGACATSGGFPSDPSIVNSLGMRLVRIPAGDFLMGSSPEEAARQAALMKQKGITSWYTDSPVSEAPARRTRLTKPFYMSVYETRLAEFARFVEETGYRTDAERDGKGADGKRDGKWTTASGFTWRDMGFERSGEFPVVNVSWNDAAAFCEWLSRKEGRRYRLPTEAEWEYACRAGSAGLYSWGDDDARRNEFAWTGANSGGFAHPVGQLKPNAWGLHDMLGNVYEYALDRFVAKPYDPAETEDPRGPASGALRVVRSGSWGTDPMHPRCAFRGGAAPDHRNRRDGFRVVLVSE